jgi:glycosyltransferase involved in cell wall biosynthesis
MSSRSRELSVVCPAFEEEEVLPLFHRELTQVLAAAGLADRTEIIYVDDGSRDRTLLVAKELAARDPRVQYVSLSRNFGKEAALLAGFQHAVGDHVVTLDTDLQHPPALIPLLLAKAHEGYDLVLTQRQEDRNLSVGKRLWSKLFFGMLRRATGNRVGSVNCDYCLLSRRVVESLLQLPERHRFLRGLVQWVGYPTAVVPFAPTARPAGHTKFTFGSLVGLAGDSLFSFSRMPVRLATYGGAALMGLGAILALALTAHLLFRGGVDGWAWAIASQLLLSACTLLSVGILGEYVSRTYEEVKGRPPYLVKESSCKPHANAIADERRAA